MRGRYLVFEGLDGSGITTQATLLRNYLQSKGKDVILTKEPTDGLIGGLIKACLRREWKTDPRTLQTLFAADRAHHLVNEIEPALKKGKIVICDRYIMSSYAFGMLEVPMNILKMLNQDFRMPNMTFFVDTQPKVCVDRIKKARPHIEIFEEEVKLQQIRKNFIAIKKDFPEVYVIDGNRPHDDVFTDIQKIINKVLLTSAY